MKNMAEENKKIVVRCRGVIVNEGKILVVRHAPEGKYFALPGGHLEWGESVLDCIKREMIEELGIKPIIGRLLYINNFVSSDFIHSIEFFFEIINSADYLNIKSLDGSHKHELAEICWVEKGEKKEIVPPVILVDLNNGTILSDTVRFI